MITVERIIGFALRDQTVLDSLGEALRSDLVTADPFYRACVIFADDFFGERHKMPLEGDWDLWISSLPEGRREGIREALGRLWGQDISGYDPGFFGEKVIEELRGVAARNAVARLNASPESVSPEIIQTLSDTVAGIGTGNIQGLASLRDLDIWLPLMSQDDPLLPTGFPALDRVIGGWGEELWIVFADSGVGKSMFLQNAGAHAAQKGKNVCHITLELGLRPQIHRYYREIAEADRQKFSRDPAKVKKDLQHWFRFAKGNVHLLEFPAYSQSPEAISRILARVERQAGTLGFVIIDYLDLLSPPAGSKGRSTHEDLGRITHLIRAITQQFSVPVLTASQAVRKPQNARRLTVRDMGDSYQKIRGADGILSLMQDDDEEKLHQGRLGVLKSRESGGKGAEIPLYINRDLSLIAGLDHPNTVQLMERLGHLPKPKPPDSLIE